MSKENGTTLFKFLCNEALNLYGVFIAVIYVFAITRGYLTVRKRPMAVIEVFVIWCIILYVGRFLRYVAVRYFSLKNDLEPSIRFRRTLKRLTWIFWGLMVLEYCLWDVF
jgi:hypothetical protein